MYSNIFSFRNLVTLFIFLFGYSLSYADTLIKIGVRAHNGEQAALQQWSATADYLTRNINGYQFSIVPIIDFDKMKEAVDANKVDFVLTNPAAYIDLELHHGVSRIATLINSRGKNATNMFGGVILTRSDRKDINSLKDIAGKNFMAVDSQAFGGWWMALGELMNNNIDPYEVCKKVLFAGTQRKVVFAILNGDADVGTVRTGILEQMADKGDINLDDIKIVNRKNSNFSLPHSTPLYPEWPLAKTKNTANLLAKKVNNILLNMKSDDPASVAGDYTGWTVPLAYEDIHTLLKELKVGAYQDYQQFTMQEVVRKYWLQLVLLAYALLMIMIVAIYVARVNKSLRAAKKSLELEIVERKKVEQDLVKSLNEVRSLRDILPICSFCKKIRDDDGYWEQVDVYFRQHAQTDFSHGVCPDCMQQHYPSAYEKIKNREKDSQS